MMITVWSSKGQRLVILDESVWGGHDGLLDDQREEHSSRNSTHSRWTDNA